MLNYILSLTNMSQGEARNKRPDPHSHVFALL